jgi:putative FmdB family regulatory protein
MPIYEFKCKKCGEKFELRRSISESDETAKCPRCGSQQSERVFSAFGISSSGCAPSGVQGSS